MEASRESGTFVVFFFFLLHSACPGTWGGGVRLGKMAESHPVPSFGHRHRPHGQRPQGFPVAESQTTDPAPLGPLCPAQLAAWASVAEVSGGSRLRQPHCQAGIPGEPGEEAPGTCLRKWGEGSWSPLTPTDPSHGDAPAVAHSFRSAFGLCLGSPGGNFHGLYALGPLNFSQEV